MRENSRRHADGDALRAQHQHDRQLRGQEDRLLLTAVVARLELREALVEEGLASERRQPALDVAGRCRGVPREHGAEVALSLDEVFLVRQDHQGVADRCVAVRVELHRLADDVGDLVEAPVVHGVHGGQDAPLHGFEAVAQVGDRPVHDHVAGVLEEVALHERLDGTHDLSSRLTRCR